MRYLKVKYELQKPIIVATEDADFDDMKAWYERFDDVAFCYEISCEDARTYVARMKKEHSELVSCGLLEEAGRYSSSIGIVVMRYDSYFDWYFAEQIVL